MNRVHWKQRHDSAQSLLNFSNYFSLSKCIFIICLSFRVFAYQCHYFNFIIINWSHLVSVFISYWAVDWGVCFCKTNVT